MQNGGGVLTQPIQIDLSSFMFLMRASWEQAVSFSWLILLEI